MSGYQSRRGSGYLERAVADAGGPEEFEAGDVSTRDVLDRYVSALGGTLTIADFGDEQLKVG